VKAVKRTGQVRIDFSRLAGPAISHDRIALFNSGLVTASTYRRDREFFRRTRPEHLRIDLGWGAEWMPWTREIVTLEDGEPRYDFAETDEIASILNDHGVRPYWSYCYVPKALRAPDSDWRTLAEDDGPWVDMVTAYAAGAAERGVRIGYHEIYNEPDLRDERRGDPVFFAGDLDDYLELYRRTSKALRAAMPHALIGGPALASVHKNAEWLRPFIDMVVAEDLPLDFLSFHHYGTFGLGSVLDTVLGVLGDYPQLDQVELHMNEYNSFTIDYPRGGLQDGFLLAGAFAEDAKRLLETRRLTRTSWAQFLDSGNDNYSGMIDIDGHAKPLFHAYEFFQHMPADSCTAEVDAPDGIGVLASRSDGYGAALVWNRSSREVELDVTAVGGAEPSAIRMIDSTRDGSAATGWDGSPFILERGAVACIEYGHRTAVLASRRLVERVRYDYADRTPGAWTDVDEIDATVRFGSGAATSDLRVGIDLRNESVPTDLSAIARRVTFADGSAAPGSITVDAEPRGDHTTLWFQLRGAAPDTFGWAKPSSEGVAQ